MSKNIIIIIIVVIVVVGAYIIWQNDSTLPSDRASIPIEAGQPEAKKKAVPEVSSDAREITVLGADYSFSPSSISVKAGEKVKLTFINNGKAVHNLVSGELGISTKTIASGVSDVIEFTSPTHGNYTFFCSVPGHLAAGMEGSLKVE